MHSQNFQSTLSLGLRGNGESNGQETHQRPNIESYWVYKLSINVSFLQYMYVDSIGSMHIILTHFSMQKIAHSKISVPLSLWLGGNGESKGTRK